MPGCTPTLGPQVCDGWKYPVTAVSVVCLLWGSATVLPSSIKVLCNDFMSEISRVKKTKALEPQMSKNHEAASFCRRLLSWQGWSPPAVKCRGEAVESSGKWRELWFTEYLAAFSLENWVGEQAGFGAGIPHSSLCFARSFLTSDLV